MIRLAFHELRVRKGATALAAIGLLTATLGFSILGLTARSTTATLVGDVQRAWNTPYDLLVRPPGTQSDLERLQGLVRPNFMTGIHGGITLAQLAAIRGIDGVEVAAPLASVGFVHWPAALQLPLPSSSATMYRIRAVETADAGRSTYPIEERYVIVADSGVLDGRSASLRIGTRVLSCLYPVSCFAGRTCFDTCTNGGYPSSASANYYLPLVQPIAIAGIDPVAEAQLAGLDRCVSSGRYLRGNETLVEGGDIGEAFTKLPVLVSTTPFIDANVHVEITKADDDAWLSAAPTSVKSWSAVSSVDRNVGDLYRSYLPSIHDYLDPWPIWSSGEVQYQAIGPREVTAVPAAPSTGIYDKIAVSEYGIPDKLLIPPESTDVPMRPVIIHPDVDRTPSGRPLETYRSKAWNVVGTYDPTCIPGFDPLAGGALEAYSYPVVQVPGGATLGPTRSMTSYVNSPPLLLTTLDGAAWLANRDRYEEQPGAYFLSVIRVRVAGVAVPSMTAQAQLARVAAAIKDTTGLAVDVVKGASPDIVSVHLPAGRFGRPELVVEEPWSVKGVAIRFLGTVDAQDALLGSLGLVGATMLVGASALTAVRRRRFEFAVLRAIGWSPWWIAGLIELETLMLGTFVGFIGLGVTFLLGVLFGIGVTPLQLISTLPVAVIVSAAAGALPARAAASGSTASTLGGARPLFSSAHPSRSIAVLGVRDLLARSPVEVLLGTASLALGFVLLGTIVLLALAFRGQLDTTVLGVHLAARVQPYHVAIGVVVLVVGALASGQVVALAFLERRRELAALRAIGWPAIAILRLIIIQASVMISLGLGTGIAALVIETQILHASSAALLTSALLGVVLTLLATLVALIVPLRAAYRLSAAATLRGE